MEDSVYPGVYLPIPGSFCGIPSVGTHPRKTRQVGDDTALDIQSPPLWNPTWCGAYVVVSVVRETFRAFQAECSRWQVLAAWWSFNTILYFATL